MPRAADVVFLLALAAALYAVASGVAGFARDDPRSHARPAAQSSAR